MKRLSTGIADTRLHRLGIVERLKRVDNQGVCGLKNRLLDLRHRRRGPPNDPIRTLRCLSEQGNQRFPQVSLFDQVVLRAPRVLDVRSHITSFAQRLLKPFRQRTGFHLDNLLDTSNDGLAQQQSWYC